MTAGANARANPGTNAEEERRYSIPDGRHRVEEEINRSRFITTVAHTPAVEDARAFIDAMRAEFSDASHNCWAYVVGPPGSTAQIGMSDDGEPHGTAGKPMLTVLLHSDVGDICAVVTRYFGGTLLGKGGLVKAYSGGVQLALAELPLLEKVPTTQLVVMVDYATVTPLKRLLPDYEAELVDEDYAVDVTYTLNLPTSQVAPLTATLTTLTNGQALIEEAPTASAGSTNAGSTNAESTIDDLGAPAGNATGNATGEESGSRP